MKSSYVERAERFIQQVASYIDGCTDYIDLNRAMCDFMMEHPRRNISVKHGMARMALVTSDYVIKMNYDDDWVDSVGGCEEEMEFYATAESEGMGHLFAKITRYEYEGRKYYIMPRIHGIREDNWRDAYSYMSFAESKWCKSHKLYDLHSGNYGFRDGHVCIFDYGCTERDQDGSPNFFIYYQMYDI